MEEYLGEKVLDVKDTEFKDYTPSDWAICFIEKYGQIDGGHHKAWVLDQIVRILKGTKVIVKQASWSSGHKEYRLMLDEPSANYEKWVEEMKGDIVDGEYEYGYDEGIAP